MRTDAPDITGSFKACIQSEWRAPIGRPGKRFVGAEAIYRNEIAVLRLRWHATGVRSVGVTTDLPADHSAIGGYGRSKKLKTSCWKRR
jgi:hypothetical protein